MKKAYSLDTKEQNLVFREIAIAEGWTLEHLSLSTYNVLPDGVADLDCGDMTDDNRQGIVEFKSFADFVNTYTEQGGARAQEQVIKMQATGLPFCVIIHGSAISWIDSMRGILDDPAVVMQQAWYKIFRLCYEYKFGYLHAPGPVEAVVAAKSFLEKCVLQPRGWPHYNYLRQSADVPEAILQQIPNIGRATASGVLECVDSIADLCARALADPVACMKYLAKNARDCGPGRAKAIVEALLTRPVAREKK